MGIYLVLYSASLAASLAFYWLSKRQAEEIYESLSMFLCVLMLFFFVYAIATKDPIEDLVTTIPAFWQFLLTALGGAFTIWNVYLNPLKKKYTKWVAKSER